MNKKLDIIGSYNSLRDPHLRQHFRKPQIRRHLLKSNIIDKDNKIIDEITTTKHRQNLERKQKYELYRMLNVLIQEKQNKNQHLKNYENDNNDDSLRFDTNELLDQAKSIVMRNGDKSKKVDHPDDNSLLTSSYQRNNLIQKLDRMIKTIKEHHEQELNDKRSNFEHRNVLKNRSDSSLKKCKSFHDVSHCDRQHQQQFQSHESLNKPSISTPPLTRSLSNLRRPKSSYGRQRLPASSPSNNGSLKINNSNLKKSKSLINVQSIQDDSNDDDDGIKSLDGESFEDSDQDDHNKSSYLTSSSPLTLSMNYSRFNLNSRKCHFSTIDLSTPTSSESSGGSSGYGSIGKKYYAFDKRFIKTSHLHSKQKIKMKLRYNGLNGATNIGDRRNIKIYQQISIGGNSILIFDGFVKPGETFTFDVRSHVNNSFSITILVDGIRDLRLNTCCERKHRPGTTLSHFTIIDVIGGRACFNCQLMYSDYNYFNNDYYNKHQQQQKQTKQSKQIDDDRQLSSDYNFLDHSSPTTPTSNPNDLIDINQNSTIKQPDADENNKDDSEDDNDLKTNHMAENTPNGNKYEQSKSTDESTTTTTTKQSKNKTKTIRFDTTPIINDIEIIDNDDFEDDNFNDDYHSIIDSLDTETMPEIFDDDINNNNQNSDN